MTLFAPSGRRRTPSRSDVAFIQSIQQSPFDRKVDGRELVHTAASDFFR